MTDEIRACLHEIASEEADYHYEGAEGLWARKDQIPSDPSEFSEAEYEKLLSPERLEEINDGQKITEAELVLLQKTRLEKLLDDCGDADVTTGYSLVEIVDGDGNTGIAVYLCTGYSFSGLNIWVLDVFDTREDALAYLNENGWTSD
jgi:hypothetical protein